MAEIPCAEARDSDFGDLDPEAQEAIATAAEKAKAAEHYGKLAEQAAAMFKPRVRHEWQVYSTQHCSDTRSTFCDAEAGSVRICVARYDSTASITFTPAEAEALGAELIAAAAAARGAG